MRKLAVGIIVLCAQMSHAIACLPGGTDSTIQQALTTTGAEAVLCPNAAFDLYNTIYFTAPNQKIYTEGYPTDGSRALLRVVGASLTQAINGRERGGIQIRNIRVDGGRTSLGWAPGEVLIDIGGDASGAVVDRVKAWEPRSGLLKVWEGWNRLCSNVTVSNNELGPAGEPANLVSYRWSDGITFACRNSAVFGNTIVDVTDGGIVIFGSPGSIIENNTIMAVTRELLGGINMVDADGYGGDFQGTIVRSNIVTSNGAFIHIGFAMGPYAWSCDSRTNFGAVVSGNTVSGSPVGYPYAVSGVSNWTVTANTNTSTNTGISSAPCDTTRYSNALAGGFVIDRTHSSGVFQSDFVDGVLEAAVGIQRYHKRRACCL